MRQALSDGTGAGKPRGVASRSGVAYSHRMESRIQDLEEKFAHLQRVTDELSDVVAVQANEIARLTRLVEMLTAREAERELDTGGSVTLSDQRPPHW